MAENEIKVCPFRTHRERLLSMTVEGEVFENEYFMPCMKKVCPAFYITQKKYNIDRHRFSENSPVEHCRRLEN